MEPEIVDLAPTLDEVLRSVNGDKCYPYLGLVDPYSDTVFNSIQVRLAVIAELQRLRASFAGSSEETTVARVLAAAERVASDPHATLQFVGD